MIQASPIKLRSGGWGARVGSTNVREGDTLLVTTRAGKSWLAVVTRIVWRGDDVAICETRSLDRPARRKSSGCTCGAECCLPRCQCDPHCVCRGGNIYDC